MEPPDLSEPPSLTKLKEAVIIALKDGEAVFTPDPKFQASYCNADLWINGREVSVGCERTSERVAVTVERSTGGVLDLSFDSDEVADAFWDAYGVFWKDEETRNHATHHHLTLNADAAAKELGL